MSERERREQQLPPEIERQILADSDEADADKAAGIMGWALKMDPEAHGIVTVAVVTIPRCWRVACDHGGAADPEWPSACGCEPDISRAQWTDTRFWDPACAAHGVSSDWKYAQEVADEVRQHAERAKRRGGTDGTAEDPAGA